MEISLLHELFSHAPAGWWSDRGCDAENPTGDTELQQHFHLSGISAGSTTHFTVSCNCYFDDDDDYDDCMSKSTDCDDDD